MTAPASHRPVVTVLSPTLSGNALFRTQVIVRLLKQQFDVQLIGFDRDGASYAPLAADPDAQAEARYFAPGIVGWTRRAKGLTRTVRGQALVCVKPLLGLFGAGLLLQRRMKLPLLLDIDDWEPGFLSSAPYWELRAQKHRWLTRTSSSLFTRLLDGFIYRADAVLVSNTFLQGVYGGHWVPHTRDPRQFTDASGSPATAGEKTAVFCGAARGHKGLPTLLAAWRHLAPADAYLDLIVSNPDDTALQKAGVREAPRVRVLGPVPFAEVPGYLARASVVVIPQDNAAGSVGQLPAKLVEAMAIGRPILGTDVGDTARWLAGGAGVVVTPGVPELMADALGTLLAAPELWQELGHRARARFLTYGSDDVVGPRLCAVVDHAIRRVPLKAEPAFSAG